MPPHFRDFFNRQAELWVPLAFTPAQLSGNGYTNEWLALSARLERGVSIEAAQSEMKLFGEQLKQTFPDQFPPDWSLVTTSLDEKATGRIRPALLMLLGAVGFVLLIACANVANLLLARAAGRQKEVAIRTPISMTSFHEPLREGGRSATADRGSNAARRVLVVAEVALRPVQSWSAVGQLGKVNGAGAADLAAIHGDGGTASPLVARRAQVLGVLLLAAAQLRHGRPRQLPPVIGARGGDGPVDGRTMKQQDDVPHRMQFHEVPALTPELLRAQEVAPARGKGASTSGNVEPIVASHLEMMAEELIRRLLEAPIGAGDDQRARTVRQPFPEGPAHGPTQSSGEGARTTRISPAVRSTSGGVGSRGHEAAIVSMRASITCRALGVSLPTRSMNRTTTGSVGSIAPRSLTTEPDIPMGETPSLSFRRMQPEHVPFGVVGQCDEPVLTDRRLALMDSAAG